MYDAKYDVWLGNARGNSYSRGHQNLNADKSNQYWNFSWHEIGKYDIAAAIDYVLNATNKSALHCVGHSQGTTTFFVLLSERPEYNKKIITFHAMAPVMYMRESKISNLFIDNLDNLEVRLQFKNVLSTHSLN